MLKKMFPGMYEYYLHLGRQKKIKEIASLKRLTIEEYMKLDAQLYAEKVGHPLDWAHLTSYTEKMQWEKLFDVNPMKARLTDKYLVRDWVARKIGEQYLIPLLGVWDCFDDVDFKKLPDQFVLKTNHGSGTNVIVREKKKACRRRIKRTLDDWMQIDYAFNTGFEMHYSHIRPKIIAEQYLEAENGELQDYKFLCFHGEVYYCWVDLGRYTKHVRNVYDLNWRLQPWNQGKKENADHLLERPQNFDKMIELARTLCQGFSHVRVDLYNVKGRIYFGEMTFTNGSGLDPILPSEYDELLGSLWKIDATVPEEYLHNA